MGKNTKKPPSTEKKSVETATYYASSNPVRVEILAYLNEGPKSPTDLASLLGMEHNALEHHVKGLLAAGSIELAEIEEGSGNTSKHLYRAVELPFYTDEEMWALPESARHKIYGLILQASMAEALAAFEAGKISNDPRVWMSWRWFNVDAKGREDLADEQARSWARNLEIEVESTDRRAKSGEDAVSMLVTSYCYERCRNVSVPPAMAGRKSDRPKKSERPENTA